MIPRGFLFFLHLSRNSSVLLTSAKAERDCYLQNQQVTLWHTTCNNFGKTERKGGHENEDHIDKTGSVHRSRGGIGALRDLRSFTRQFFGRRGRSQVCRHALRSSPRFGDPPTIDGFSVNAHRRRRVWSGDRSGN